MGENVLLRITYFLQAQNYTMHYICNSKRTGQLKKQAWNYNKLDCYKVCYKEIRLVPFRVSLHFYFILFLWGFLLYASNINQKGTHEQKVALLTDYKISYNDGNLQTCMFIGLLSTSTKFLFTGTCSSSLIKLLPW